MNQEPYNDSNESPKTANNNQSHNNQLDSSHKIEDYEQSTAALFSGAQAGVFQLTNAVRPSSRAKIVPRQGYRRDTYSDSKQGVMLPVILASATRETVFDLFLDLLNPLGNVVDVVLETSHQQRDGSHVDLYREHIDSPVLKSMFCDFENLLMQDGCTGVAVVNAQKQMEVQFDEHKMLMVYSHDLTRFEEILFEADVWPMEDMQFLTEVDHVHASSPALQRRFDELCCRLGMDVWSEVEY